jgi:4-amino-4-deoxychorismate lyase
VTLVATVVAGRPATLHDSTTALLRADDLGVLRGDGVFETTLVVNGEPRDLAEHLARMAISAAMTDLALPDAAAWRNAVDAVVAAGEPPAEASLRLVATRGPEHGGDPTCFVTLGAVAGSTVAQRSGASVLLLDRGFAGTEAAKAPWLLAGAKTLSYAVNMAAQRYARANGADDVVFVGSDGAILEGPTATVVVADGRTLTTPPPDGILAGITVRRLFAAAAAAGWTVRESMLTPADLGRAEGVWLASSVRLLAPVVAIDGVARSAGPQHPELARLLEVPGF